MSHADTTGTVRPILRLVLGDQLNPCHSWFADTREDVVYVLMEMRQETDYARHHAQKVLAILAAMRDFAARLKDAGHRVRYVALDDPSNRHDLAANLDALLAHYQASELHWQQADGWRVDRQLADFSARCVVPCVCVDSEHFLARREEVADVFRGRKRWLMEHFYRHMRRRYRILVTPDGQPEGGQWNFDHDNRQRWPGSPAEPPDLRPSHDHTALWCMIQSQGVSTVGEANADRFRWPLNRAEALAQLGQFIADGLPHFGAFQDALSSRGWRLFHSLISFALNVKMLHPREVIDAVEAAWRCGAVPIAAAEGFIRQVLGWREYVRGVYWAQMPGYTGSNALAHDRPLPEWFWTGRTRMACVAAAIGQTLQHAYAHHIQRLMVIGNFALLAGLDPQALHRWYLGVYVDAFEWVEAPNTIGMSQFADGGLLATKPYVSSAAYLQRMGDHCKGCHYKPTEKTGATACPFNALYWDFFARHAPRLRGNQRLSMVYRNWERMDASQQQSLREQAALTLKRLDEV